MPETVSFIPTPRRGSVAVYSGAWLFNIALAAFLASILASGGLFLYRRSLDASEADWQEQVKTQEAELRPDLLSQISDLTTSIGVARELITGHVYASGVLLLLESATHPFVGFGAMGFSRDSKKIDLTGVANSYRSVSEQINIFESHPQVEKVEFGGLSVGERGLVNFKLAVVFKPGLLAQRR